eukprot:7142263-Pyramimonas_sp.AAC.1
MRETAGRSIAAAPSKLPGGRLEDTPDPAIDCCAGCPETSSPPAQNFRSESSRGDGGASRK